MAPIHRTHAAQLCEMAAHGRPPTQPCSQTWQPLTGVLTRCIKTPPCARTWLQGVLTKGPPAPSCVLEATRTLMPGRSQAWTGVLGGGEASEATFPTLASVPTQSKWGPCAPCSFLNGNLFATNDVWGAGLSHISRLLYKRALPPPPDPTRPPFALPCLHPCPHSAPR